MSLQPHSDASAVTMNINLNLEDKHFTGSEVDFVDRQLGQIKRAIFKPGMALIHRGSVPNASQLLQLRIWLDKNLEQSTPNQLLHNTMSYTLNQWTKLDTYLEDGRKIWTLNGNHTGVTASAKPYSIIETAKANNLESTNYILPDI